MSVSDTATGTQHLSFAYCATCDHFYPAAPTCPRMHRDGIVPPAQPIPRGTKRRLRGEGDE